MTIALRAPYPENNSTCDFVVPAKRLGCVVRCGKPAVVALVSDGDGETAACADCARKHAHAILDYLDDTALTRAAQQRASGCTPP